MSTPVDFIYGGGLVSSVPNLASDWSLVAGAKVVVAVAVRNPDTVPYTVSGVTGLSQKDASSPDFTGTVLYIATAVASGGTVTVTPDTTGGVGSDHWQCYIIEVDEGTYVAANADALGFFQASVNYGPWTAPGAAGLVLGFIFCSSGDTYDIDTPVGLIDDEHAPVGFLNGGCLGAKALTSAETGNVTGTQNVSDIGVVNAAWIVFATAASAAPPAALVRRRQPFQRGLITAPSRYR